MDLSDSEIRVLACLLEKQRTTPDHYPLSLNSLRLACNQATNRDPVMSYDDAVIRDALHRLDRRGYIRLASGRSSRTAKYRHLLSEALPMSDGEQAVMCVLMLRGPQTPGELKQRSERMHAFAGLDGVHETLTALIGRGLVTQLHRRPGQKEERYAQQLGEDAVPGSEESLPVSTHVSGEGIVSTPAFPQGPGLPERGLPQRGLPEGELPERGASERGLSERVHRLEQEVVELRGALAELRGERTVPSLEPDRQDEPSPDDTAETERPWGGEVAQPAP